LSLPIGFLFAPPFAVLLGLPVTSMLAAWPIASAAVPVAVFVGWLLVQP
jgi:hypothetical protein